MEQLAIAGLKTDFDDITPNVAEPCRLDGRRRRDVIRSRAPFVANLPLGTRLDNLAAVEGGRKYNALAQGPAILRNDGCR